MRIKSILLATVASFSLLAASATPAMAFTESAPYTISVPESVTLTSESSGTGKYTGQVSMKASGQILDDEHLCFSAPQTVTMVNGQDKAKVTLEKSPDTDTDHDKDSIANDTAHTDYSISTELTPGSWRGAVNFYVTTGRQLEVSMDDTTKNLLEDWEDMAIAEFEVEDNGILSIDENGNIVPIKEGVTKVTKKVYKNPDKSELLYVTTDYVTVSGESAVIDKAKMWDSFQNMAVKPTSVTFSKQSKVPTTAVSKGEIQKDGTSRVDFYVDGDSRVIIAPTKSDEITMYAPVDASYFLANKDEHDQTCAGLGESLKTVTFDGLDTSKTEDMHAMFYGCHNLVDVRNQNWNTGKVKDMGSMFLNCNALQKVNTSNWDTQNVRDMGYMFSCCIKLATLDVSSWNTENVVDFRHFASYGNSLSSIIVNKEFAAKNLPEAGMNDGMFYNSNPITLKFCGEMSDALQNYNFAADNCTVRQNEIEGSTIDKEKMWAAFQNLEVRPSVVDFCKRNEVPADAVKVAEVNKAGDASIGFYQSIDKTTVYLAPVESDTAVMYTPEDASFFLADKTDEQTFAGIGETLKTVRAGNLNTSKTKGGVEEFDGMAGMFAFNGVLESVDVSKFDTSNVGNMAGMFVYCGSLKYVDVSKWNTRNVKSTDMMFYSCAALNKIDVSNWDTSNIVSMDSMFAECQFEEINVSKWNVGKAENMDMMFLDCVNLKRFDVSNWDTSNVVSMKGMFAGCPFEEIDVSKWNVGNVKNMNAMFSGCTNLKRLDISGWDTSNVTELDAIFYGCQELNSLIVGDKFMTKNLPVPGENTGVFYTGNSTSIAIIGQASAALKSYDFEKDNRSAAFYDSISEDPIINRQMMWAAFQSLDVKPSTVDFCKKSEVPVDAVKIADVNDGAAAGVGFYQSADKATVYMAPLDSDDKAVYTPENAACFLADKSGTNVFAGIGETLKVVRAGNLNTSKTIGGNNTDDGMAGMFAFDGVLESVDVSKFDTSNVKNMMGMFAQCKSLKSIDVSSWDTSNLILAVNMFNGCKVLNTIDVSGWDVSNVVLIGSMFEDCASLKSLDISGWDTSKVENFVWLFKNCESLQRLTVGDKFMAANLPAPGKDTGAFYMDNGCDITIVGNASDALRAYNFAADNRTVTFASAAGDEAADDSAVITASEQLNASSYAGSEETKEPVNPSNSSASKSDKTAESSVSDIGSAVTSESVSSGSESMAA